MMIIVKNIKASLTQNIELLDRIDPYVVLLYGKKRHATAVYSGGWRAHWPQSFVFEKTNETVLKVQVWDWDDLSPDDLVGEGVIDLSEAIGAATGRDGSYQVEIFYKQKSVGMINFELSVGGVDMATATSVVAGMSGTGWRAKEMAVSKANSTDTLPTKTGQNWIQQHNQPQNQQNQQNAQQTPQQLQQLQQKTQYPQYGHIPPQPQPLAQFNRVPQQPTIDPRITHAQSTVMKVPQQQSFVQPRPQQFQSFAQLNPAQQQIRRF